MSQANLTQQTKAMLAAVWAKNRELLLHRLDSLDAFCRALPGAASDRTLRSEGAADAHKLAGSLGMFGLSEGTTLARDIEHKLNDGTAEGLLADDIPALVARLRTLIEQYQVLAEAPPPPQRRHRVLMIEDGSGLPQQIHATAAKRGMEAAVAPHVDAARALLKKESFDIVILDLGRSVADDEAEKVRELVLSHPPMQVLALTSVDSFEDRVTAAQVGAHGFLPKTVSAAEIVDTCEHLLDLQTAEFKVLAVDDDAAVLAALKALLGQHSIRVTTLSDPRLFWNVLQDSMPDLVILDLEMPNFSGLELCRAIRNDAQWNRIPLIFMSAGNDPQTITGIFSAGADDFVAKPLIAIELTTRVRNRLERDRLYRTLSDYDQLTNVRNRRSSNVVIANYLRLAERHGLPVSLVIIDLDKFKRVNDTYGHQAGDDVLQHLGGLLRQSFRSEDVVARWGGEEFVVAMFAMRRADAIERMAEVLEQLENHEFEPTAGTRFRVSFSAGVAEFPVDGKDLHTLYRLSDEALYRAKEAGGRRIYSTSTAPVARAQTEIAIVSTNVAVSAPLRHLLEMRGYSVELYQNPRNAVHELTGESSGMTARIVVLDELPGHATVDLAAQLRDVSMEPKPTIFLLTSPGTPVDPALDGLERIEKPYKPSWLMQRVRKILAH